MSEPVHRRGALVVAVVTVLAIVSSVFMTSQCTGERPGPQGRLAPDSNEGAYGQGSPATKRSTPALNPGQDGSVANTVSPDSGRNAPAAPGATPQDTPTGSLTEGADVEPAPAAPVDR